MKLKYSLRDKEKIYTIKDDKDPNLKDAHHKFIKIRDAPKGPLPEHKKRFRKKSK